MRLGGRRMMEKLRPERYGRADSRKHRSLPRRTCSRFHQRLRRRKSSRAWQRSAGHREDDALMAHLVRYRWGQHVLQVSVLFSTAHLKSWKRPEKGREECILPSFQICMGTVLHLTGCSKIYASRALSV